MNMLKNLRIIYHMVAFTIFLNGALRSLGKFFQNPVVIQESSSSSFMIEKPFTQVCFKYFYNWENASEFGYTWKSHFLAGIIPNSTRPTWKGKYGNLTFKTIQEAVFPRRFDDVKVSTPHRIIFKSGRGYCLETQSLDRKQLVTSNVNHLRVYIVHNSTDSTILYDQTPLKIGPTSDHTFDYKVYKIFYNVIDKTIFEGKSCVDYRKLNESYGDCNYRTLKEYLYSTYGCYPPWIEKALGDACEMNNQSWSTKFNPKNTVFEDIASLNTGIMPQSFKLCQEPCYQVKVSHKEVWQIKNMEGSACLEIHDNDEVVWIHTAVYSFDIFLLAVELGSNLGLWLGKGDLL